MHYRANWDNRAERRTGQWICRWMKLGFCAASAMAFFTAMSLERKLYADLLFTDRAAFEAGLPSGYFFNDFADAPDAIFGPAASYSASGGSPLVGYTFSGPPGGLFIAPFTGDANSPRFIGPWEDSDDLLITFNTGNVFRAGLEIFIEDFDDRLAGSVTVDFGNGTSTVVNVPEVGDYAFIGIYSDTPLSWMAIRAVGGGVYTNTTSMYAAIPEPSSLLLCGISIVAMAVRRRRVR